MFYYSSGEMVQKNDRIKSWQGDHWIKGIVKLVIEPGTPDSLNFHCPQSGGVLLEEDWDGVPNLIFAVHLNNNKLNEDYELESREDQK